MKVDFDTDVGAVRSSNQDSCECGLLPENGAWTAVCDGMGGANGGNVASSIAVGKIKEVIASGYDPKMSDEELKDLMLGAVTQANTEVYDMSVEQEELRGMGTTVVLLIARDGALHAAHVGDSRGYLKNKDGLIQITMDHSYVQDLVNRGQLTPEQARSHPRRNIITRVLGVYDEVLCDYAKFDFKEGDIALACSDGLTNYADNTLLLDYIERYGKDGDALAKELIRYAVESGGSDNVTVAVIKNC